MAKKILEREECDRMRVAHCGTCQGRIFAEFNGAATGISLELLKVPLLGELTESSYELGDSSAKGLSQNVRVVLLRSASAGLFFAKKVSDAGSPGIESPLDEECSFDWRDAGREVETGKSIVDGRNVITAENDFFVVGVITQLLLEKGDEAWGDVGGGLGLRAVGVRAKRGGHRHQLKS